MDTRETLKANENFNHLLLSSKKDDEKTSLLFDDNGLTRAEGKITTIDLEAKAPYIILTDGTQVFIESIIAVNGIFKDDYTEC